MWCTTGVNLGLFLFLMNGFGIPQAVKSKLLLYAEHPCLVFQRKTFVNDLWIRPPIMSGSFIVFRAFGIIIT